MVRFNPEPSSVTCGFDSINCLCLKAGTPTPFPAPTSVPKSVPSLLPSAAPTELPVPAPTELVPTPAPMPAPTFFPTSEPSSPAPPTTVPTPGPMPVPSPAPTPYPTATPSEYPTMEPTPSPTMKPTPFPTMEPTPLGNFTVASSGTCESYLRSAATCEKAANEYRANSWDGEIQSNDLKPPGCHLTQDNEPMVQFNPLLSSVQTCGFDGINCLCLKESTKAPTQVPTSVPYPAPVPQPTTSPEPTAADFLSVEVSLALDITSNAAPTLAESNNLKNAVATELKLYPENIQGWTIVAVQGVRRRLLASTWTATFTVVTTYTDANVNAASAYAQEVASTLSATSFQTAVTNVNADATVDTSHFSTNVVALTRNPSSAPVSVFIFCSCRGLTYDVALFV
jgi:hypothetical protein